MRTIGTIGLKHDVQPRPYPGLSDARLFYLESELQRLLREGIAKKVYWSSVVVHTEADRARLRSRSEVVAELQEAGIHELARKVERALVVTGHFLAFIDIDGLTMVNVVNLTKALEGR